MACRAFCTEAAVKICHHVLELFGGSGVMRELPIQKYVRDSLVLLHMNGSNPLNRIRIGAILGARAADVRLSR
jgi:alkylation response protein AidB-like acyl-CoA dehydrogenase